MDNETFRALRVILDDHNRDDPAGTRGGNDPDADIEDAFTMDIEDLERLNRAYEMVGAWYWKMALELPRQ